MNSAGAIFLLLLSSHLSSQLPSVGLGDDNPRKRRRLAAEAEDQYNRDVASILLALTLVKAQQVSGDVLPGFFFEIISSAESIGSKSCMLLLLGLFLFVSLLRCLGSARSQEDLGIFQKK